MQTARRTFIQLATAFAIVPAPVDDYQNFLDHVREHVIKIVRREHLAIVRMEIAPPRVVGGEKLREVRLWLQGLEPPFTWDEPWN